MGGPVDKVIHIIHHIVHNIKNHHHIINYKCDVFHIYHLTIITSYKMCQIDVITLLSYQFIITSSNNRQITLNHLHLITSNMHFERSSVS